MASGKTPLEGQFGRGGRHGEGFGGVGGGASQTQESNTRFKERLISLSIPPSLARPAEVSVTYSRSTLH